ncbi:MAG: hypothetical protein HC824_03465 [Synechococcales cyanobacterium RM1_1_8]|nr:hypothetical protein [Synechococcales cyanobacterium RM1_1_8]
MDPNRFSEVRSIQLRGLGSLLLGLVALFALISILPDWFVELSTFLVALVVIAPIVGFVGLRWWLNRNIVQGSCPVCAAPLSALQGRPLTCPSCGESLLVKDRQFVRQTPPGTVDVEVISSQAIDD